MAEAGSGSAILCRMAVAMRTSNLSPAVRSAGRNIDVIRHEDASLRVITRRFAGTGTGDLQWPLRQIRKGIMFAIQHAAVFERMWFVFPAV